ncbi:MAG: LysR family transcriptional regulator [Gammaproteobacteria bacterium]
MDDLTDIVVFVRVVEAKSFTAAAERLGIAKSVVSKYVTRLEERLGARLLNRTTRRLSLTEAGAALYEGSRLALEEIAIAERCVSHVQAAPRGWLKLNAPMSFGILHLGPALPEFLTRYPEITLDVSYNDRFVDVIEEGYDVTLRIITALPDSTLVARSLTPIRFVVCAAPLYLERAGVPETPEDLIRHNCLLFTLTSGNEWHFNGPGGKRSVAVSGSYRSNNGMAIRDMLLAGMGVARTPTFMVGEALQSGALITVLDNYPTESSTLYGVYPHNRYLSPKVRAFVGFSCRALRAARPVGSRHGSGAGSRMK